MLTTCNAEQLKARFKSLDLDIDESYGIRIHRAISWLRAAEETPSLDLKVISLWISLNACYAIADHEKETKERSKLTEFLEQLVRADQHQKLHELFWNTFSGPIRNLLDNEFIYRPFWEYHRGRVTDWKTSFRRENERALKLLMTPNHEVEFINIVLNRLYQMRNQLVHGGATYESSVNREQIKQSSQILESFVPLVIEIMLDRPNSAWGEIRYPVVDT